MGHVTANILRGCITRFQLAKVRPRFVRVAIKTRSLYINTDVRRFQMKLSKGENSQRRGINRAKFADPIKVALHISEIRNELKQVTTPAGSFHVAFMLGPLIIESGLQE